jgi:hypothetical protein
VKFIREACLVDTRHRYGEFSSLFSLQDRKDFEEWCARVVDEEVDLDGEGGTNDSLPKFAIMCELNRQARRKNQEQRRFQTFLATSHLATALESATLQSQTWNPQHPRMAASWTPMTARTFTSWMSPMMQETNTMYKRVANKVRPVDTPRVGVEMEFGREDWRDIAIENQLLRMSLRDAPDIGPCDHLFERRHAVFRRGTRLTPIRMSGQIFGSQLTGAEVKFFKEMMFNREAAIAFDFSESGRFSRDVCPPYKIRTVPHEAWQVKHFPVARAVEEECVDMINDRLDRGTLERCDSQYRNPWFLVRKKDGKHRLINNAQHMNRVTIRDANLAPTADEFSEWFACCLILSLMDMFSGYDQMTLHEESRDMTAFQTLVGLVRSCTIVQGATNSVAAFQRVITRVLRAHWPWARPFIDDITVGGPKTDYGGEEALPGVRRYVLEHIQQLDRVLADVERAGATVSGTKCSWGMDRLGVVGYEVSAAGRHPDRNKVEKIRRWPDCRNVTEVRAFIGICVYYRVWVHCFALRAKPLFLLLRNDAEWTWEGPQKEAMADLKSCITHAPALITPNYRTGGTLFVGVDASGEGGGAVLEQIGEDGRRHPCRFASTMWSAAEGKWHSTKLECKAVVWALSEFRSWLYGQHFVIETDAQTLIAQLNRSSAEVPGAVVNRWLGAILMWDFEIKHVPGKKNVVADALSRYPKPDGWTAPEEPEDDVEDFIEHLIANMEAGPIQTRTRVLMDEYSDESEEYAVFLTTAKAPKMALSKLPKWKKIALNFFVRDGYLFRKTSRNVAIRRVIDDPDLRTAAIWDVHHQLGHRGVNAVYTILAQRYWWKNMHADVRRRLAACRECQLRSSKRRVDMMTNTYTFALWECVAMDIVYMPESNGKKFLILAREYLSGWVEGRALPNNKSSTIAQFIYEDIICRWCMTRRIMVDGGPDFQKAVVYLAERYGAKRIQASSHNPQAMGKIEGGHKPIVNALAKIDGAWTTNLPTVLLADRISVQESTGYSPYQMVTGQNPVLPIELSLPTWQTLPFRKVQTRAELLAVRAMQLDLRDQFVKDAAARVRRLRQRKKEYWDEHKEIQHEEFLPNELVLLWDSVREIDMSRIRKLDARWLGPYRISAKKASNPEKGTYQLEDLDGTMFRHTTPGRCLKSFQERDPSDIAAEERGTSKMWNPALWPRENQFRTPPAGDDNSGVVEDPRRQQTTPEPRNLRSLAVQGPMNAGKTPQHTIVQVKPRVITPEERAMYEQPIYDDTGSESDDSDAREN